MGHFCHPSRVVWLVEHENGIQLQWDFRLCQPSRAVCSKIRIKSLIFCENDRQLERFDVLILFGSLKRGWRLLGPVGHLMACQRTSLVPPWGRPRQPKGPLKALNWGLVHEAWPPEAPTSSKCVVLLSKTKLFEKGHF